MKNIIKINEYELSYTLVKINKIVYWVTTPHGIFLDSENKYYGMNNGKEYLLKLVKQSYWCDLVFFTSEDLDEKVNNLKIFKNKKKILNSVVKSSNGKIGGKIIDYKYSCHLDIKGGNRNLFYQVKRTKGKIQSGLSGSGFYNEEKLIGILSHGDNKNFFLIPSFFINIILNEKCSDFSPFVNLSLDIKNDKLICLNNHKQVLKFNGYNVKNDSVYCPMIKDYLPVDVYLQIFLKKDDILVLNFEDMELNFDIKNLNDVLRFPFLSNISMIEKDRLAKVSYQDLFKHKDNEKIRDLIFNNLLIGNI